MMTYRVLQNILLVGCFLLLVVVLFPSFLLEKWESRPKVNVPTVAAATIVQVWTYQKTGLYYCPDSKFYGTLKPGRYMVQDKALESGYRPAGAAILPVTSLSTSSVLLPPQTRSPFVKPSAHHSQRALQRLGRAFNGSRTARLAPAETLLTSPQERFPAGDIDYSFPIERRNRDQTPDKCDEFIRHCSEGIIRHGSRSYFDPAKILKVRENVIVNREQRLQTDASLQQS